jgi:hypothetical protein
MKKLAGAIFALLVLGLTLPRVAQPFFWPGIL